MSRAGVSADRDSTAVATPEATGVPFPQFGCLRRPAWLATLNWLSVMFWGFPLIAFAALIVVETTMLTVFVIVGIYVSIVAAVIVVIRMLSEAKLQREIDWVSTLPFPTEGYIKSLSAGPYKVSGRGHQGYDIASASSRVRVIMEWEAGMEGDPVPDLEALRSAYAATRLGREEVSFEYMGYEKASLEQLLECRFDCGHLRDWYRRFVTAFLIPLHRSHRLRKVTVQNF